MRHSSLLGTLPAKLGGLLVLLAACALPLSAQGPDLVIVHTNDLHAHYRSFPSRNGELRGGFARIAGRIAELRAEHGERLLYLDAGDLFVGTPYYHYYRGTLGMALLEQMGCDAMALGNHELDDGALNFLRASVGADFPVLCANLFRADGGALLPADTRLRAGGLEVAVIGLITEAMPELAAECASGKLHVTPAATALGDWLPAQGDADLALALSHCGLRADREIAAAVPGLPLIIGGHSHSFLDEPERVGDTLICHTGCYGYNLGVLECYREQDGTWRFEERIEPVSADWPEDPVVAELLARAGAVVEREMDVVLTVLPEAFEGRGKSTQPDPLGILIAELMRAEAGADLALQNVGGYRTYLTRGPVTRGRLFELLPFDNRLLRLTMTGADLQSFFDYLAAQHNSYRFSQISGASYAVGEGGAREVRIGGKALDPDRSYTLAAVDFLYGGGDGYTVLQTATRVDTLDAFARELLEERLLKGPPPRPADFPPNFTVLRSTE